MKSAGDRKDTDEKLQQGYLVLDAYLKENGGLPTPELFRGAGTHTRE